MVTIYFCAFPINGDFTCSSESRNYIKNQTNRCMKFGIEPELRVGLFVNVQIVIVIGFPDGKTGFVYLVGKENIYKG